MSFQNIGGEVEEARGVPGELLRGLRRRGGPRRGKSEGGKARPDGRVSEPVALAFDLASFIWNQRYARRPSCSASSDASWTSSQEEAIEERLEEAHEELRLRLTETPRTRLAVVIAKS